MKPTIAAWRSISRGVRRHAWLLGVGISVAIISYAVATLVRLLHDIEPAKVLTAVQAMPWQTVAVASLFVVAGYITLTFYDFFALRTIGRRDIPYRVAALASFTSYTVGHNLGVTVLTGGAVRYRIYSAWGINVTGVAKIAFVTGLTFWLGNAFILGIGLVYAPEAAGPITQLPPWLNRAIGLAALAAIVAYVLWLVPRTRVIGRDNWCLALPNAKLTAVQIAIGVLDLGFCATAMYTLLPESPPTEFLPFMVVFVAATLLGFLSHAPGSLGVLDAALLVSLPALEREPLLAALLIFRALYFLLPFVIALLLLGLCELCSASRRRPGLEPSGRFRL